MTETIANQQTRSTVRRFGCGAVLAVGGLGLVVLIAAVVGFVAWYWNGAQQTNAGEYAFEQPLDIPELLEPEVDEDGRKVFDLTYEEGETELLPGTVTETWGLNGTYLSPTVRAEQGDEVVVNVHSNVDETTTLHWHGMHLPAAMDGGPHQPIDPGETWSPEWTVNQPAGTLWFHPHTHGKTAEHVYRGAAGMFIVDDPELEDLAIPQEYGVDDIPLIVQDKKFNGDGSLDFSGSFLSTMGVLGDEILVNGTHAPKFEATTELVRFRVLNASNARVYDFGFEDDREFQAIGTDSGLLESPAGLTRLTLSPGERAEIVVEVEPGDDVMLKSFPPDLGAGFWGDRIDGGDDEFEILRIQAADQLAESEPLPEQLVSIDRLDESDAVTTRTFSMDGDNLINGQSMDMSRIDEVVELDTTEIWEIENAGGMFHNFHIHLIHFQILDIDGEEPPEHLRGWKDTVFLPDGATVRVIAEFKDYADPEMPYMYHCHILQHEDNGMMGQFVVVEPGTEVPEQIEFDDHDHHDHH